MKDLEKLYNEYNKYVKQNLSLDLTRGKPSSKQLDISNDILNNIDSNFLSNKAFDPRNYSAANLLTGLPEMKEIFSEMLNINPQIIIIGGNSSLNMMYDTILRAMIFPLPGENLSWKDQGKVKFLCPTPGYDRHFNICESMGIEMIPVPLTGKGPDMEIVTKLVASDPSIKGIWCVPQYSNPTGETYCKETVNQLANMKTVASDFRIFWDNAYAVHDLTEKKERVTNIFDCCNDNNIDRIFMYASTSKITYASGGVAMVAMSENNRNWFIQQMKQQTIGYDKINQIRHIKFLKGGENIKNHMKKHAQIMLPKFQIIDVILKKYLGSDNKYASWNMPNGGYFIDYNTAKKHIAKRVVDLSAKAGVKLTAAGSSFPYGKDINGCNVRIAPSFPSENDITTAITVLALSTKIATLENK